MAIKVSRKRILVGLRRRDWTHVWYEPLVEPEDLQDDDFVPDIGLYSEAHGDTTGDDPALGEVAWEPLFDPKYFASSKEKERNAMQRKMLWITWRYLMAAPADVNHFRMDLMESQDPRSRAIERDAREARKRRSNAAKQTESRKRKRQRVGEVIRSIEHGGAGSESESETDSNSNDSGHETEVSDAGNSGREKGTVSNSMPPPRRPETQRASSGPRRTPTPRDRTTSSGLFVARESQVPTPMMSEGSGSGPRGQGRAAWAGRLFDSQGSRGGTNGSFRANSEMPAKTRREMSLLDLASTAFGPSILRTPLSLEKKPELEKGKSQRTQGLDENEVQTGNGGFDQQDAIREAERMSQAPENPSPANAGLDEDDAIQEAIRLSQVTANSGPADDEMENVQAIQAAVRGSVMPEKVKSMNGDLNGNEALEAARRNNEAVEDWSF